MTRVEAAVTELAAALRAEILEELARDASGPERLLSVAEAGAALGGISRTLVYSLISSGQLRSCRVGRRRLISSGAIRDFSESGSQVA